MVNMIRFQAKIIGDLDKLTIFGASKGEIVRVMHSGDSGFLRQR